jgi:hypothetical protein
MAKTRRNINGAWRHIGCVILYYKLAYVAAGWQWLAVSQLAGWRISWQWRKKRKAKTAAKAAAGENESESEESIEKAGWRQQQRSEINRRNIGGSWHGINVGENEGESNRNESVMSASAKKMSR